MSLPATRVTIVEVGPRDGLQNDPLTYTTDAKVAFIESLADAGLPVIEAASFVSPAAIPQLADSDDVMRKLTRRDGVRYVALVPNERGYDRAVAAGVDAIALFASTPAATARSYPRSFGTSATYRTPSRRVSFRITSSESASCGIAAGLTKLAASMTGSPASASDSMKATFASVV